jgi:transketolase
MRASIIDSLFAKMQTNEDIFFLTADMGINLVEKFQEAYPSRFLNVGIAEQNLIGVSAGLCNLGYRPFVYTISNFLIHRCYEQIRNDIVIHNYPVTLLGTTIGFDNAPLGPTHHGVDDWGALRTIPGIDIYCPSSVIYAQQLIDKVIDLARPAYIRIGKGAFKQPEAAEDMVYLPAPSQDCLLVSYGAAVQNCLKVQETHNNVSVLVCNRLRPLDETVLKKALEAHPKVIVVEDHFPSTGLYGMLCQFCMEQHIRCSLESLAPQEYALKVGASSAYYDRLYNLGVEGICNCVSQP